jgi:DNA polymerase-1
MRTRESELDLRRGLRWLEKPALGATYVVGFDVETWVIRRGLQIPRLVCASFAWKNGKTPPGWKTTKGRWAFNQFVVERDRAYEYFKQCVLDRRVTIVAHNAAFDTAVMALVALERDEEWFFKEIVLAYEEGRIRCTAIRQNLIDIANGEHKYHWDDRAINKKTGQPGKRMKTVYDLEQVVWRHQGEKLEKNETWRLFYDRLDGVDATDYPDDAYLYSLLDSVKALDIHESQSNCLQWDDEETAGQRVPLIPNEIPQTCTNFALYLMGAHGVRTSRMRTEKLAEDLQKRVSKSYAILKHWGMVRGAKVKGQKSGKEGSKNTAIIYRVVEAAYAEAGLKVPRTKTGKVSTDAEALDAVTLSDADFDMLMKAYEEGYAPLDDEEIWTAAAKVSVLANIADANYTLSNFVPNLLKGVDAPVNPWWNVLVESGRTSCRNPNFQNPPRKGGVRECIEARAGFVFISADYDTLELRTLSQVCYTLFGFSEMREAILRGEDLHSSFAAGLMGLTYEEFAKRMADGDTECEEQRQFAKIVNFGAPGGLGANGLVGYAKGYGVVIDIAQARKLLAAWHRRWPEMKQFFNYNKALTTGGEGAVTQLFSNRYRGGCRYTSACNTWFQGLAADGAKDAIWRFFKESYLDPTSAVYGCRLTLFLHDELIAECPWANTVSGRKRASDAAARLKEIMVEAMQSWLPDVPAKASPVMMKRWYKGAKPVNDNGVMVPSFPKKETGPDGKSKVKWYPDEEFMNAA